MKKKSYKIIAVVLIILGVLFLGSGFMKRTDVFLGEYIVSKDGTKNHKLVLQKNEKTKHWNRVKNLPRLG